MSWRNVILDDLKYNYVYFSNNNVCRICWCQNANIDICTEENLKSKLLDKINYCLDIDIRYFDHMNKICDSCRHEIDNFNEFKTFCRDTDVRLHRILETGADFKVDIKLEFTNIPKSESITAHEEDSSHEPDNQIKKAKIRKITNFRTKSESTNGDFSIKPEKKIKKLKINKVKGLNSSTYCNICRIQLENEQKLSQHNSQSHGIEENGFKCFGCEKRFKTRRARLCHELKFCKGLKDGYKCSACERYLPKRRMYETHMRGHLHNVIADLPECVFKCKKCLKLFKTKNCLNKHLLSEHKDAKNFVCDTCGRVFTRQDYLYKHQLTHTGVKRYNCPHCDFKATQRSSLTMHIRKHTGERPYSCDMCPQKCISSSNLRAHRRRHFGLKKYECTICNKKFGYKISLDEHISSTHERIEQHTCQYCGTTYSRVRGLRRHITAKHGDQNIVPKVTNVTDSTNEVVNIANNSEGSRENTKGMEYEIKEGDLLLIKNPACEVFMVC